MKTIAFHTRRTTELGGEVSHTITWDNRLETEEPIVPSVTCYADIPFNALSIHVSKYGKFGVALPSHLLIKYGARPVIYIPMRSDDWQSTHGLTLLRNIESIVKGFNEQVVEKQEEAYPEGRRLGEKPSPNEAAVSAVYDMLLKDFLAFVKPFNSELPYNHSRNFYMEREWRKYGNMKFEPAQISKVVVATGYKKRVEEDFPAYKDRIFEI